jgi:hypothetical protein
MIKATKNGERLCQRMEFEEAELSMRGLPEPHSHLSAVAAGLHCMTGLLVVRHTAMNNIHHNTGDVGELLASMA